MSAEFFGQPIKVERVIKPLLSVPENCSIECIEMDEEYSRACRDAVLNAGNVYVVSCPNFVDGECGATRINVGSIKIDGNFFVSPHFTADKKVSEKLSEITGANVEAVEQSVEGHTGTTKLLHCILEHGLKEYYS